MTSRERVTAAVAHEPPDRLPCDESFWEDTIEAWREQGFPRDVAPADYFDFDLRFMYLDTSPRFEQKVLAREGPYVTYADRFGYTVKKFADRCSTMEFRNHVTQDRAAWEHVRPRFVLSDDPAEPARIDDASCFAHLDPYPTWEQAVEKYQRLYSTNRYLLFAAYGPWESTWRHRGYENLLTDVMDDPDWVREMADTHQALVIAVLKRCIDRGMKPDGFFAVDDLGHTGGLLMSPDSWRGIFRPAVERLGEFLSRNGIAFWMHSCGDVRLLIDDLIDCGVRVLNPVQVAAGLDVVQLRKRYGKRLALYGGIDARLMSGPEEAIRKNLEEKIPLAADGGYIFHSDHSVPPQVHFDRYRRILEMARQCSMEQGT